MEMFGNEHEPKNGTEFLPLGRLATFINGFAFKPDDWGLTGLPIIRIQNLTGSSETVNYYNGNYPEQVEINNGDVLISWSASLGVYLWNRGKALLNQHIFKVAFDKMDIDKYFFMFAVSQKMDEMISKTHGATMKHIVKSDFENTKIAYPPLPLQEQFAEFARQSDKSKFAILTCSNLNL